MTPFTLPKLNSHRSSASYFSELLALNKLRNPKFSHRYLAQRLKWPVSFVADLIKGRKKLTVTRALEFSKAARLNLLDTEKMIDLALSESSNPAVQSHFVDRVEKRFSHSARHLDQTSSVSQELFLDIRIGAVFEVLKWARRPLSAQQLKNLLFTFPELTVLEIERMLHMLQKQSVIEIKGRKLKILKPDLHWDQFQDGSDGGIAIHTQYGENFVRYTRKPVFPGLFTSGFVEIPRHQFTEVAKKMLELRNWLLEHSSDVQSRQKSKLEETLVFQFDINLVLMIDKIAAAAMNSATTGSKN